MKKEDIVLVEPEKYMWVQNELSQFIVQKNIKEIAPHEAFVLKRVGKLSGDIFRMFINASRPLEVQKYLETHEAGHIIFGHINNETIKDRINKPKIKAAWRKVKDLFPDPQVWENKFNSMIYNIVEDMEVNSKVFTFEEMKNLNSALGAEGIWPEDFGFPIGLDYNTYLNLVLADPKKFFNDLQDKSQDQENTDTTEDNSNNDSEGNSEDTKPQDGNTSQKESSSQDKNSSEDENNKLSKKVLKVLEKYFDENDKESQEKVAEKIEQEEVGSQEAPVKSYSSSGGATKKIETIAPVSFSSLEKVLKKLLIQEVTLSNRDPIYNYNRNKMNSSVIIPRVTSRQRSNQATLYVQLDVSGSISEEAVSKFCGAFQAISKKLNSKSRIILWNTSLVKDYSVKETIIPEAGGGTDMANGIEYISQKYKPSSQDVFFIVSDFEDSLMSWDYALQGLKCKKKAFIFSSNDLDNSVKNISKYIEKLDLPELNNLWKDTLPINIQ